MELKVKWKTIGWLGGYVVDLQVINTRKGNVREVILLVTSTRRWSNQYFLNYHTFDKHRNVRKCLGIISHIFHRKIWSDCLYFANGTIYDNFNKIILERGFTSQRELAARHLLTFSHLRSIGNDGRKTLLQVHLKIDFRPTRKMWFLWKITIFLVHAHRWRQKKWTYFNEIWHIFSQNDSLF